ncbi:replication factor A protein 3 [Neocallimastix californiae]|jgi:replication factor A3|uniref:Replication factor A protein 3 n=1 Tax=Neocallimastix californiae TaxID=1754190 RepID=A0A1Y2AUI8_9FUNG|nr:replication factor A protein 3 [Neocallimastix californiae]|eukprot:ORY26212.1 replication factor A protein 3 [Neocallimastix californiae]
MSDVVIPRINSSMFREYINKNVRVVGQVLSNQGDSVILKTSDQGNVKVSINHYGNAYNSRFVEVIGQITGEDSITETAEAIGLGDNFDMESFEKLINYQRKFPEIF